jgi:hypothetical protein
MCYGLHEEPDLTKPTITYVHGWLDDCSDATGWVQHDVVLGAVLTVVNGDYFRLTGTPDSFGGEWTYYEKDITNIPTDTYHNLLVRWRTSVAAAGLQAKISVVYDDATSTDTTLGFSTNFTTTVIALPTGKTIDKIQLYADDNPDTVMAGTFWVEFDFVLICQGIFTWPFVSGGVELEGFNNLQYLKIPGKVGNATQYLGGEDSTIHVYGDIDTTGVDAAGVPQVNQGWHGRWTTKDGETFYTILHYGFYEPWEWFTSDVCNMKVTVDRMVIRQAKSNENLLSYDLYLREYRLGSANVETNLERFGIWP